MQKKSFYKAGTSIPPLIPILRTLITDEHVECEEQAQEHAYIYLSMSPGVLEQRVMLLVLA